MPKPPIVIDRRQCHFDFDIGYLVKSPCRDCDKRKTAFPACSHDCFELARVQTVLSASVSCNKKGQ